MLRFKSFSALVLILFVMTFAAACGTRKAVQPTPNADMQDGPGFFSKTLTFDGIERDYLVYLPDEYSIETSLPLVVFLHSYGWNAEKAMKQTGFNQLAEEHGFVVVYPNAIPNWNSGISQNPDYPTPEIDDVGFIKALIAKTHDLYQIDLDRVYASGFSNGGFMSYRLACEASEEIAAIASVGGLMSNNVYENCNPKRAIPVMEIHGTRDDFVPFNGMRSWKSVYEIMDFWSNANACQSTEIEELADIEPEDGSSVVKVSHLDCDENNSVILYRVNDSGHTWPGEAGSTYGLVNQDMDASAEIWKFFSQY